MASHRSSTPELGTPPKTPPPTSVDRLDPTISPVRFGSNALSQAHRVNNDHSTHPAVKQDLMLEGKVIFETHESSSTLYEKVLHIDDIEEDDAKDCVESLMAEKREEIKMLKELASLASKKPVHDLENEQGPGQSSERLMYDPLVDILHYITNFDFARTTATEPSDSNDYVSFEEQPQRTFRKTGKMLKPDGSPMFAFAKRSPDISVVNACAQKDSKFWSDRDAFVEVKASNKQGPKPVRDEKSIRPIVTQSADYARLLMEARPFMLFCIGLLIFGTEFCVNRIDRDGSTIAFSYDMFSKEGSIIFVKVVYAISRLRIQHLGFDPTVFVLTDDEKKRIITQETDRKLDPSSSKSFIVTISLALGEKRYWCTIGAPIWTSGSLIGRGTNVWYAREYDNDQKTLSGPLMILKGGWRNSARLKESDIYHHLRGKIQGFNKFAQFECGGDALDENGIPITVDNLRHPDRDPRPPIDLLRSGEGPTPTLHRLVLRTVGRPLYEYENEEELLVALRDALEGHKFLWEAGVLHRDISIGNVLIRVPEPGTTKYGGFVTDLDYAHLQGTSITAPKSEAHINHRFVAKSDHGPIPEIVAENLIDKQDSATIPIQRGLELTGTLQFMAFELIREQTLFGHNTIRHQVHHDVESFIWVYSYAVLSSIWNRVSLYVRQPDNPNCGAIKEEMDVLRKIIADGFSVPDATHIAANRSSTSPVICFPDAYKIRNIVKTFMSQHLINVFEEFQYQLHQAQSRRNPKNLTHESIIDVINKALVQITKEGEGI